MGAVHTSLLSVGKQLPTHKVTAGDYRPLKIEAANPPTHGKWRVQRAVLTETGGNTNPTAGRERVVLHQVPQH